MPSLAQIAGDDRIIVCTSAGMVVMDRDGNIIDPTQDGGHVEVCMFCLPLLQGWLHHPDLIANNLGGARNAVTETAIAAPQVVAAAVRPVGMSRPRAPPGNPAGISSWATVG